MSDRVAVPLASCEREVPAPIDLVWDLVSTADGLTEWMSVAATVELRPGGTITWTHANGWVVAGEIREVVPMRRLVFTYGWASGGFPVPVGSSVVTIELDALGASTRVRVRHDGLTARMAAQHSGGWHLYLGELARRAATIEEDTT